MRAVLQRVTRGSVRVDDTVIGSVEQGFVILVGVGHDDGETEALWLARKIAGLRVFEDEDGKFNRSLLEIGGGCLVVSQFTLYADSRKGRRPSFTHAAPPEIAEPLIERFAELLRQAGVKHVEMGKFGARMQVAIYNDGPVTIWLDTDEVNTDS
jgi:D-tyrosyl-tRNA(Tyr) deacylase